MSDDSDATMKYHIDNNPLEEPPVPAPRPTGIEMSPHASHEDTPAPPR